MKASCKVLVFGVTLFFALYGAISAYLDWKGASQAPAATNQAATDISAQELCAYASFVNADFHGSLRAISVYAPQEGHSPEICFHFLLADGTLAQRHYRLQDILFRGIADGKMEFATPSKIVASSEL